MKKYPLIGLIIIVISILYILFVRENPYEIGTDLKLFNLRAIQQEQVHTLDLTQKFIKNENIYIDSVPSHIRRNTYSDTRFFSTDQELNPVNIFVRKNTYIDDQLTNVVLVRSRIDNNTIIDDLNIEVLLGTGSAWILDVITGP